MSHHFERGQLLYTQGRYALAADEFRAALADDPNRAEPHSYLAQCLLELGDIAGALREADEGVRLAPLHFLPHTVKAMVLHKMDRYAEAEASATEAVSNDPFAAWPFAVLANVRFSRNDWAGCLEGATRGLALDPTDAGCLSLRTLANLRLGRRADAAFSAETALRNDPNDPFAHVAEGWRRMHVGDAKGACDHFRTALRLDPTSAAARAGMIEALKARYWVYRQYARFQFWLVRQGSQFQWGFIVALFLAMQFLPRLAREQPALKPVVLPLMVALVLFGLMTWIGSGLFNLLLLFHPLGRRALNRAEKREGWWLGGLLVLGLAGAAAGLLATDLFPTGSDEGLVVTLVGLDTMLAAIAALVAVSGWYRVAVGWPRLVLTLALVAVWGMWAVMLWLVNDLFGVETDGAIRAAVAALKQGQEVQVGIGIGTAVGANILMASHPNRD